MGGNRPAEKWQDVRQLRNGDYIRYFLNCGMNCLALAGLGSDFEEREEMLKNGQIKTKLVKVGTKFKAGGGESFGYEPHLLLELSLERKNRQSQRAGAGRRRPHGAPRRCAEGQNLGFERAHLPLV